VNVISCLDHSSKFISLRSSPFTLFLCFLFVVFDYELFGYIGHGWFSFA